VPGRAILIVKLIRKGYSMTAHTMPRAAAPAMRAMPNAGAARTYFFVSGEAGSEFLPRLLNLFIKLGLVPYRIHASTEHGSGEEMSVELRFAGLMPDRADALAARCRSIIGVRSVLTTASD
jgi:hypothetical protein